jgi:pyruvate, water dikinase
MQNPSYTKSLDSLSLSDRSKVGGKCASLGEMIKNLKSQDISVPLGFAVTVDAFNHFLKYNNIHTKIKRLLSGMNKELMDSVTKTGKELRSLVLSSKLPPDVSRQIISGYSDLCKLYKNGALPVAVRSSSVHEDGQTESYAGQQDSFLNVTGEDDILKCVIKCYASLYTDRALSYKSKTGVEPMAVCIQKMVRSDLGASGVMFTVDTESGFDDVIIINGSWGLGELIVGGKVVPDEYTVWKRNLVLIDKKIGNKDKKMVFSTEEGKHVDIQETDLKEKETFCLTDQQATDLATQGYRIERYYRQKGYNHIDIEWGLDGTDNKLYVVQARAETTTSKLDHDTLHQYCIEPGQEQKKLVTGIAVGEKVGTGKVRIIHSLEDTSAVSQFKQGDILVTEFTEPDWEPLMRIAGAIVTEKGGRTCHAAIIAREQGTPAVVGTGNATRLLRDNQPVTVSCCEGAEGLVYSGELKWIKKSVDIKKYRDFKCPVDIMYNLASPDIAFKVSRQPNKGIGLAREEHIINNFIGIHPCALIDYARLDNKLKEEINKKLIGYRNLDPTEFYIKKLAYGIAKISVAFFPYAVIVRFSDFKSNEYRNLLGGAAYEPSEENPMIGWRGASRYYAKEFKEAFALECKAIKYVRDVMGLTNVVVMIPFCRTPQECKNVLAVMKENGLERGKNGLQVYLMCEIPSNVILAEEFLSLVDGYSIGSNDLTQLMLGLDRDSHLVSHVYSERDPAVMRMIKQVITTAKSMNKKIGICGQAPSDFPDFCNFLTECGIDSISITPDSTLKVLDTLMSRKA